MNRRHRNRFARTLVCALPVLLLGAANCTFDSTGQGTAPSLGAGKPCMVASVKFLLFAPGLGTEGPAIPGSSTLLGQCQDKAAGIPFQWTLERELPSGDIEELGTFTEIDSIGISVQPNTPVHCIATAHIGASVFFDLVAGDADLLNPDFSFGMFRVSHSAPGWSHTCEFVEVTTCPNPLGVDPSPIWASHTTRDVADCEQGMASVPLGQGPVNDDVPFP